MVWVGPKAHKQDISLEEQGLWVKLIKDETKTLLVTLVFTIITYKPKSNTICQLNPIGVIFLIVLCAFMIGWTDYWEIRRLRLTEKIEHQNQRLKQNGKPLCGLYAFLNGVFSQEDISQKEEQIDKVVDKIWWLSLDKEIKLKDKEMIAKSDLSFSLVGEFFASNAIEDFFDYRENESNNQDRNFDKNHLNILKELHSVDASIEDYTIKAIENEKKFRDAYHNIKDENTFFIIPYNVGTNVHWICLKYIHNKGKYYILNSAKNTSNEYRSLRFKVPLKKLRTLNQVVSAWNYVREAKSKNEKFNEFDFGKWVKSCDGCKAEEKYTDMLEDNNEENNSLTERFKDIKDSHIKYEYAYNEQCGDKVYSRFDILKVTVKRR